MSDSDEFDAYDLSEFTADDFAAIDADLARARGGPVVAIALEDSPFRKFLSWKKHLAVTDIVSPLWCEVQYEYGLYGQRHRPLHRRPSAFTSRSGKQIRVHQPVARANDQRLKRGKSVHKALENELTPEKLVVRVVSGEERFALRLLQLIDGFSQLVTNGIARELPVFAITHAHVVLGVIDEVLRLPSSRSDQDQAISPSPSASSPTMKQQRSSSPTHPSTPSPSELPTVMNADDSYQLCIVDYKTRRSSDVPLDEDSLSPRLQLMMYHRMLSSVLQPETFDFALLWNLLDLDPTKPFSSQFLKDILWDQRRVDPTDCNVHLNHLVSEWTSTVQRNRTGFVGVSRQLQIVYRRSVYAGKRDKGKQKATQTVGMDDPLEALALQEELDLTRAIEESLSGMGHGGANQVAHHVAQHVKQVGADSVGRTSAVWKDLVSSSVSGGADPMLAWTIQQSLLDCAERARPPMSTDGLQQIDSTHGGTLPGESRACSSCLDGPAVDETRPIVIASEEQGQEGTTLDISPIIGQKVFRMNDEELDTRIADVLQWWFGARPARGVDIGRTNRCFTCEYRDSCEWREQKAKEAAALVLGQSRNHVWPTAPPRG